MQQCSKCGQSFDAESCPFCGNPAQVSSGIGWGNDKSLNKYGALLTAGICGSLLADRLYKLLDGITLMAVAFALAFVSGGTAFLLFLASKPTPWNLQLQKRLLAFVVVVVFLYSTCVILNGALDRYPPVQAETRVVRTYQGGKYNRGFFIVVAPSWRQGQNQEDFQVIGEFDGDLQSGDLIRVEVHRGAFWLPWGPVVIKRNR